MPDEFLTIPVVVRSLGPAASGSVWRLRRMEYDRSVPSAAVNGHGDHIAVAFDGQEPISLHAMWIRDACRCAACRRPATNERLFDSTTIPETITIIDSSITADAMTAVMSDGHTVRIGTDWLAEHLIRQRTALGPAGVSSTSSPISQLLCSTRADLDQRRDLAGFIDRVLTQGASIVTNVEPTEAGLRGVAELLGPIESTNYGDTWEITATIEPVSAVDSERRLAVHTDLPYRTAPPGLQLLLAAVVDVDGGASTLVDGYAAAEQLRIDDADAWALLTRTVFTFPYIRDDTEIHGVTPLIALTAEGCYGSIRRAPDLIGVPLIEAATAPALYRALRLWAAILDDPAREMSVRLEPGELLAFDNHRMLHGRTSFELDASGRRHLLGCYLSLDDVRSRRAVLGRSLG